jgi:hypothetical protein
MEDQEAKVVLDVKIDLMKRFPWICFAKILAKYTKVIKDNIWGYATKLRLGPHHHCRKKPRLKFIA